MVVNTTNQLIDILNKANADATVLAAIANDSATSTTSGPSAGLVTTRLGSNVKNLQKVIADYEATLSQTATVATLPAANIVGAGSRHFVTDANATTFASIVAGSGANGVPVYSDGTNWRIG